MFVNVLVPFDGSEPSHRAVAAALKLAKGNESAKITVLKVAPPMNFDDSTFEVAARMAGVPKIDKEILEATRSNYASESKKLIQGEIEKFFESVPDNIDVAIEVKNGKPHEVICEYALDNNMDCIVMGRRGLGAIRGALGSVSTAVLRGVDIPVLVVK